MAKNAIELINRAFVRIGATPIQSLEDNTAESVIAKQIYNGAKEYVLCGHTWNFATRKTVLSAVVYNGQNPVTNSSNTQNTQTYYYALPADCIRIVETNMAEYILESGIIKTYHTSPEITYIARITETDFPAFFDSALCARLAAEFCLPITDSISRSNFFYSMYEKEIDKARKNDMREKKALRLNTAVLTDVRY